MLKKMSLMKKVLLIIILNVIILLGVGTFIYTSMDKVDSIWTRYKDEAVPREESLLEIKSQFGYGGFIHNFKNYLLRGDKKYADRFEENRVNLEQAIKTFKALNINPAEKKAIQDIETVALVYVKNVAEVTRLLGETKTPTEIDAAVKVDDAPAFAAFDVIDKQFQKMEETEAENMNKTVSITKIFIVAAVVFAVILIPFLSFFMVRRFVVKPINELLQVSEAVANYDLTVRVPVESEDEIGKLGTSFNVMSDHLQELIEKVTEAVGAISSSTDEINTSSDDLATQTNEQAASITETSATVSEFTTIVQQNSDNSEEAGSTLVSFNQDIQSKSHLMNNVTSTMEEIHEAGKKIDSIVTVINDISFQTNLLALNAAVEAARAGEAGRGFAVVASEVRNLAQKTAESSKTIQEIVSHNVESTEKGKELVNETSGFFSNIIQVMQDIVNKISMITEGSKEQATGIEQINGAVSQLEDVINRNAALAEELSGTVKGQRSYSAQLEELVKRFKLDKGAAAVSTASTTYSTPAPRKAQPSSPVPVQSSAPPSPKKKKKAKKEEPEKDFFSEDEGDFEEF